MAYLSARMSFCFVGFGGEGGLFFGLQFVLLVFDMASEQPLILLCMPNSTIGKLVERGPLCRL